MNPNKISAWGDYITWLTLAVAYKTCDLSLGFGVFHPNQKVFERKVLREDET